jgi:hypothetical protein
VFVVYRHLVIEAPIASPTQQELAAIEEELGTGLPAEFTEFLSVAHGGNLEYIYHAPPTPEGEELSVGHIFRTRSSDKRGYSRETFLTHLHVERLHKELPRPVLPFARGGGDAMLYLDLTPEGAGRVVVYLQGLPAWAGLREESAFIEVAPSFGSFVESLRVDEAYCIECLQGALEKGNPEAVRYGVVFLDLALLGWRNKYRSLTHGLGRSE